MRCDVAGIALCGAACCGYSSSFCFTTDHDYLSPHYDASHNLLAMQNRSFFNTATHRGDEKMPLESQAHSLSFLQKMISACVGN